LTESLTPEDAISDEILMIDKFLKNKGHDASISTHIKQDAILGVDVYQNVRPDSETILILHVSSGGELNRWILEQPGKKIMIYHNFTPPKFFEKFNDKHNVQGLLERTVSELMAMRDTFDIVYAKSQFSATELEKKYGYKDVKVLPIIFDYKNVKRIQPDKFTVAQLQKDEATKNILFLGRIVPHKCQADLVRAFYFYNKFFEPNSQLHIVGKKDEIYIKEVERVISVFDLEDKVNITGVVSDAVMYAYYQEADLFLSMSEHEGFFVPSLECMYFGVPMLLYRSTAVAETPGNAAIYFDKKDFFKIASMMDIILKDNSIRDELVKRGKERLEEFSF